MQFDFNPFFNGRFVFENESKNTITDPGSGGGMAGRIRRMGALAYLPQESEVSETSGKEIAKDTGKALEEAKEMEGKKAEDDKTKKELEKARKETPGKLFENPDEHEKIRGAIEKLNPQQLKEYYDTHKPETYNSRMWTTWNMDFVKNVMALTDVTSPIPRKYAWVFQEWLRDGKYDPGTVDGQIGKKTTEGLGRYLCANGYQDVCAAIEGEKTAEGGKKKESDLEFTDGNWGQFYNIYIQALRKGHPDLDIGRGYIVDQNTFKQVFGDILGKAFDPYEIENWKDQFIDLLYSGLVPADDLFKIYPYSLEGTREEAQQPAEGAVAEGTAPAPDAKETRKEKMERLKAELRAELAGKGATKEALFAFEMAYDDRFISKIKPAMAATENFDKTAPDSWAAVHSALIGDTEYATAFASWPAQAAAPADVEEKIKELGADVRGRKMKQLESVIFMRDNWITETHENARSAQIADYKKLQEEKSRDPSTWFLHFDYIKGSAPDIAFQKYKEVYERRVGDEGADPMGDPEVSRAFAALGNVVREYYDRLGVISPKVKSEYRKKLLRVIEYYDLPEDVDMGDLDFVKITTVSGVHGGTSKQENPAYIWQKQKVVPVELRTSEGMSRFIANFFDKTFPTHKINSIGELKEKLKGPDKEATLSNLRSVAGNDDERLIDHINQAVYLGNMYQVHNESMRLQGEFEKELDKRAKEIDNAIIAQYFPPEKKNVEVASK